jgi:hypothetical protein
MSSEPPVKRRRSTNSLKKPGRKRTNERATSEPSTVAQRSEERIRKPRTRSSSTCETTPITRSRRTSVASKQPVLTSQEVAPSPERKGALIPPSNRVCEICRKMGQPWAELVWYKNVGGTYQMVEAEDGSVGGMLVHQLCAQWSDRTKEIDNKQVIGLGEAVERSKLQQCHHCSKLGANVSCQVEDCNKMYHVLCISKAGVFIDTQAKTFLCEEHLSQVTDGDLSCTACNLCNQHTGILCCVKCSKRYHSKCEGYQQPIYLGAYTDWQCRNCQTCPICGKASDIQSCITCSACSKCYHCSCVNYKRSLGVAGSYRCQVIDAKICPSVSSVCLASSIHAFLLFIGLYCQGK